MKRAFPSIVCFTFLLLFAAQATAEDATGKTDLVVHLQRPEAKIMLVIPHESDPVKGVIAHVANKSRKPDSKWTELCRSMGYAHMVISIDMKRNRRPRRLRENVPAGLDDIAVLLDRPDLKTCLIATVGHSAGGMGLKALNPLEERFFTSANDCAWTYSADDIEKKPYMAHTPLLFTIGAIPDAFKMLEHIDTSYDPLREADYPYTLGPEWGKAHKTGNSLTLLCTWFPVIDQMRNPDDQRLLPVKAEHGWLGSRDDWDSNYATIAAYADYPGDKKKATWLPNRSFAFTWRAYQSKGSPVTLALSQEAKSMKLSEDGKALSFSIDAGSTLSLGVSLKEGTHLSRVRYFNGDQLVAESTSAPFAATWSEVPQGVVALHAEWTLIDGTVGVTRPALLVAKAPHPQKVVKHSNK